MHNLTSWASRKKYVKPWSLSDKKGHHFTDSIKPHLRSGCFPFHSQTLILVNRLAVWAIATVILDGALHGNTSDGVGAQWSQWPCQAIVLEGELSQVEFLPCLTVFGLPSASHFGWVLSRFVFPVFPRQGVGWWQFWHWGFPFEV